MAGSLTIVGSGIKLVQDTTIGARLCIEKADKVLVLVTDIAVESWISKLNPNVESLLDCYTDGGPRIEAYRKIIDRILMYVRRGLNVCVVFYGHPGVFVDPSHEAIRLARLEGYSARMLPGISTEDCLFADLGIDPGAMGCQSFEATDFLVHRRKFDTTSTLILWQIGVIGNPNFDITGNYVDTRIRGLRVLVKVLKEHYNGDHDTIIYQAPQFPIARPYILHVPLDKIPEATFSGVCTLYVPPKALPALDEHIVNLLGLKLPQKSRNKDTTLTRHKN